MSAARARTVRLAAVCCLVAAAVPADGARAAEAATCFGSPATIVGTGGNDRLTGTASDDVIVGRGGIDQVEAGAGDDKVCLGPGGTIGRPELARGGRGNDRLDGAAGSDSLDGGGGRDLARGGGGRDYLVGGSANDTLDGGGETDNFNGGSGDDVLRGGRGSDSMKGGPDDDVIAGGPHGGAGDWADFAGSPGVALDLAKQTAEGAGADTLRGIENASGSDGDDDLVGNRHRNIFFGGIGDDNLEGRGGDDCLYPGRDENTVSGGAGYDFYTANAITICRNTAHPGSNVPVGNDGVVVDLDAGTASSDVETSQLDSIEGAAGTSQRDTFRGDDGDNTFLAAGSGDDVFGGGGDDMLDGGGGTDRLEGGDGTDECVAGEIVLSCEGEALPSPQRR